MRRLADLVMRSLARLLIRVFFRQVEVQGLDRLPSTAPVVLVANHINGLVDGLLLMAALGRYPRFLGKSTLFKIPPLWPFLKQAGVIPVYRVIDGAAGDHNASAFATSRAILARGGLVALFPEGISHDESSLQPLRTGAARIALEADVDGGIENVVTVAVGLTYDAKARFRSRALVRLAEPQRVERWAAAYRSDPHDAVRQVTDELAEQLATVSPPYASWAQVERLARLAEVVVRPPEGGWPADVDLAEVAGVADCLARAEGENPPALLGLLGVFATYQRDLDLLGLTDAQVTANYSRGRWRGALLYSLLKVLAALPPALLGIVVHLLPFQIVKQLAKRPRNEGMKATVKLLGCFTGFVIVYAALGYGIGRWLGAWAGAAAAVASPIGGYVAVRLFERLKRIGGLLEGYHTVRERSPVLDTVYAHRTAVVEATHQVLADASSVGWDHPQPDGQSDPRQGHQHPHHV